MNTDTYAAEWLQKTALAHGDRSDVDNAACVVGLSGHLGAGKTAFVKRIAHELGITETVTSPTFVIMKIYEAPAETDTPFRRLVHIDAYRLERRADLGALDFERISTDPHALVMIEWPENAGLTRTDLDQWLRFEIEDGTYRIHETK